jgi:predicted membrane-bound mannosyltransferase
MLGSRLVKRALVALVVVVLGVCAGIGVLGQVRRARREAAAERAAEQRAAAVEASKTPLQKAAATIELTRRTGEVAHFAVVPKVQPPGLTGMEAFGNTASDGVTDIYSYGRLKVFVRYTADPGPRPCFEHTCLRDGAVGFVTADAPSLAHASIWLTGTPSPPDETAVRRFWTKTTWVPIAEATWFTDLAIQGERRPY